MNIAYHLSSTKKQAGIYMIQNLVNKKVYIGSSINLYNRFYNHIVALRNGAHFSQHLQMSFNKYGENNFLFSVLYEELDLNMNKEELSKSLLIKEEEFIKKYKSTNKKFGYNTNSKPSLPPMLNKKHSKKTREIMSKKQTGELNHNFGKKFSQKTKQKMSMARRNQIRKPMNDETKNKIRKSMKNNGHKPSKKAIEKSLLKRQREIVQFSLDGEFLREFNSIKEASDITGARGSDICACCNGRQKSCKGYIWRYKESE